MTLITCLKLDTSLYYEYQINWIYFGGATQHAQNQFREVRFLNWSYKKSNQ